MTRDEIGKQAAALARRREPYVLATVVWRRHPTSGRPGMKALITSRGRLHGWLGGACTEPLVIEEALAALRREQPALLTLGPEETLPPPSEGRTRRPNTCVSQGSLEVFLEPQLPPPQLVVVGREAPLVDTLVRLAEILDFDTVVVDPTPPGEPAGSQAGEPAVSQAGEPAVSKKDGRVVEGLDLEAAQVDERSFVVVATMGRCDEEALEQALRSDAPYVALVSFRRRGEAVREELGRRGLSRDEIAKLRAPAGLDLGPVSHREIAVCVLAEIVELKARGLPARRPAEEAQEVAQAVDPVCGMTVEPSKGRYRTEHGGTLYYFCCSGCQRRFEADPAAFLKAS